MNIKYSSIQLQGGRHEQQDRLLARYTGDGDLIVLVADGLGGHFYGDWAADAGISAAVDTLYVGLLLPQQPLPELVKRAIEDGHQAVQVQTPSGFPVPATTLVGGVFPVSGDRVCIFSVGDSLAVRVREGIPPEILNPRSLASCLGVNTEQSWIKEFEIKVGDTYVFASDGIESFLNPGFTAMATASPRACCEHIARIILAADDPDQDNATVLVVRVAL